jgi:class 3 adenylate cyclase
MARQTRPEAPDRGAVDQLQAVRDVLQAIARSPFDLDGVLQIAVERAVTLCQADYGYVFVPATGGYVVAAWHGGPPEQAEYERQHPTPVTPATMVGRVVLGGKAVQIVDALADPDYDWSIATENGVRTLMGVPIRTEERLIGVFGAARTSVRAFSQDEIDLAQTFADQAAIVIENVRLLGTIQRQREELAGYLPTTVAELVSAPDGERLLAGHRRDVTAVFCDLRGFTAFAESAEPEEVLPLLRQYHEEMGAIIVRHHGTLEHYAGDGMMVFLNDPQEVPDHTLEAVRMAVEMRDRFAELAAAWRRQGFDLGLGIGVSVGFASLGRIGFEGHYGYAVIGSVANLAARLCAIAEPGQIVLSERAYTRVEAWCEARPLGSVELKGFRRPVEAYSLTSLRTPATA